MYDEQDPSADDAEQAQTNSEMLAQFATGQSHALYGSAFVAFMGIGLVLGLLSPHLLYVGLLLVIVGVGLFVVLWAHGFDH